MTNPTNELNNIDNSRSYATEEGLLKGLAKFGFEGHRCLVVCNRQGRFTAIFPAHNIKDGNMMRYACKGFMTLG